MKNFILYKEDWKELEDLADIFIKNHSSYIREDEHKNLLKESEDAHIPLKPEEKIKILFEYHGNHVYSLKNKTSSEELLLKPVEPTYHLNENILEFLVKRFLTIKNSSRNNQIFSDNHKKAEDFRNKILKHPLYTAPNNKILKKSNTFLNLFADKNYFLYERFEREIGRKILRFGKAFHELNRISVTVETLDDEKREWEGIADFDATKTLMMIRTYYKVEPNSDIEDPNSLPKTYMFKIDYNSTSIGLLLGHTTFESKRNHNVTTRSVILKFSPKGEQLETKLFEISKGPEQEGITLEIYRYLLSRQLNRISTPHHSGVITSEMGLKTWFEENDAQKRSKRNSEIIGNYWVFYKRDVSKSGITRDSLTIEEDIHVNLSAEYTHYLQGEYIQTWKGKVTSSAVTRSAFVVLKGPLGNKDDVNASPVFIVLNIPHNPSKFDVITAVISGVRDEYFGAIGLTAVIVRKSVNSLAIGEENYQVIEKFFEDTFLVSTALPSPYVQVRNLNDLNESRSWGNYVIEHTKAIICSKNK